MPSKHQMEARVLQISHKLDCNKNKLEGKKGGVFLSKKNSLKAL